MQSDKGKEILAHAMQEGRTVLDFETDDGETTMLEITEHVNQLEEMVNND